MSIGGANTLTIGAGGVTNDGTSTYTISTAVALRANQTWANNNTTNALAITGAVSGSGKNLTLAGAGGFTFSGANTYSGTTSLLSGTTLTLSGASGTLATSAISIESSANPVDQAHRSRIAP